MMHQTYAACKETADDTPSTERVGDLWDKNLLVDALHVVLDGVLQ